MDGDRNTIEEDIIKYRKGIRCIAVADFAIGFTMLAFLSFGFFPIRLEGDKLREALGFVIFCLYTLQAIMAIVLFRGTNEVYAEFAFTKFKKWYSTSNLLNVMLFIEIYFFVFIVDGKTLIALTLCFSKVFFRVLSMQVVSYSIRDYSSRAFNAFNAINPISVLSPENGGGGGGGGGQRGAQPPNSAWNTQAPPYEDIAPPSYEDAIKSFKIDMPTPVPMPKIEVPN